jgi:ribosomal protein S1
VPRRSAPTPAEVAQREDLEPTVVEVAVSSVGEREVEVRLADGRTGVVPADDVKRAGLGSVEPGDTIRAAVLRREDPRGRVPMSAAWAATSDAWHRVEAAAGSREVLTAEVSRVVKGGLVLDLGIRAFLPRSLVGELEGDVADLVGTTVEVVVAEADRPRDRLVVSRRDAQRIRRRAEERAAWSAVATGQRHRGEVVAVEDYGAKVRLGALVGLVHRGELSWSHVGHPGDVVSVGDEVDVEVIEVNRSRRRLGLSMRRVTPHPLDAVEVGAVCGATVQRVVEYGAFALLDGSDAEGLIHLSQLSEVPGVRPDQLVVPGEHLQVKVLSVDRERGRMALSALGAQLSG